MGAVAILLLHCYVSPAYERALRTIVQRRLPGAGVTAFHEQGAGFTGSFLLVQSTGGLYEARQAREQCVRMLKSGPAAGVIGAQALCRALG